MASYIDPSFRESLLKSTQDRTAQVNFKYLKKDLTYTQILICKSNFNQFEFNKI